MMSTEAVSYVDRDEASRILNVSTRTVDRYLRKNRIKTRRDGRRILIKRTDIDRIIQEHIGHYIDLNMERSREILNGQAVEHQPTVEVKDIKIESIREPESIDSNHTLQTVSESREYHEDEEVYKDLFLEAKKDLKERQERLEAATYRVGQLETQLKNMVPLLDFTRKEKELRETQDVMEKKMFEASMNLEKTERRLKTERVAKWVYLSLVGLLLIVEPILFLYWAFT